MTSKAVLEAQEVLKEIRDKCSRAFQDTKRAEADAKGVETRQNKLEMEAQSAAALIASLEEDCVQQEKYLAEFPNRILCSTRKSEVCFFSSFLGLTFCTNVSRSLCFLQSRSRYSGRLAFRAIWFMLFLLSQNRIQNSSFFVVGKTIRQRI
jgi:hypothetical protein